MRTQFGLPGEARLVRYIVIFVSKLACVDILICSFDRENDESKGEQPIPSEFQFLVHRLRVILRHHHHSGSKSSSSSSSFYTSSNSLRLPNEALNFTPNDCNANAYIRSRGDYLTPHFDDRALSGPLLMNLSLESDAFMTYVHPKEHSAPSSSNIKVHLKRRTLQLVCGEGRWDYMHCILSEDLDPWKRRVSLTFRQSGSKLSKVQPRSENKLASRIDVQIQKLNAQQTVVVSSSKTVDKLKTSGARDEEDDEEDSSKARPLSPSPAPVPRSKSPISKPVDFNADNVGKSRAVEGLNDFGGSVKESKSYIRAVEVVDLLDD